MLELYREKKIHASNSRASRNISLETVSGADFFQKGIGAHVKIALLSQLLPETAVDAKSH
jgi:hypothetical protein